MINSASRLRLAPVLYHGSFLFSRVANYGVSSVCVLDTCRLAVLWSTNVLISGSPLVQPQAVAEAVGYKYNL